MKTSSTAPSPTSSSWRQVRRRHWFAGVQLDRDRIPGADLPHVVVASDVLLGFEVGRRVAVISEELGYTALGIAELLAERGHTVSVLSSSAVIGSDLTTTGDLQLAYKRLTPRGVVFSPMTLVEEITPASVRVRNAYSETARELPADCVVLVTGAQANDGLYRRLKGRVGRLHVIGDAVAPRRIDQAVYEGDRAARVV